MDHAAIEQPAQENTQKQNAPVVFSLPEQVMPDMWLTDYDSLYFNDNGVKVTDTEPTAENLKTLHKTIKKVELDILD